MRVTHRRVAAIDVGTNTTRLLAVDAVPPAGAAGPGTSLPPEGAAGPGTAVPLAGAAGAVEELDRRLVFTRLGQGVDASGRLLPASIERTVAAIQGFVERCGELGVTRIRIAGTSAVREATNRQELLQAVHASVGLPLEVIAGQQEAALSFAGATADLPAGRYLVLDIGGGSTELALGSKPADGGAALVEGRISLRLGVVRLTERHVTSDPVAPEELFALEADVDAALEADLSGVGFPDPAGARLVGVAGTVTSLAAIAQGLEHYDPKAVHGSWLSAEDIGRLYRDLAAMRLAQRETLPSLPPGRADVIVAGCGILSRVLARWSLGGLRVSERDILDGLVQKLLEEPVPN